jgi:hypothetical protein
MYPAVRLPAAHSDIFSYLFVQAARAAKRARTGDTVRTILAHRCTDMTLVPGNVRVAAAAVNVAHRTEGSD